MCGLSGRTQQERISTMAKAIEKSRLRWASLIYPATFEVDKADIPGHCILVFDTELHTYTTRFVTRTLNPKHLYYSGVVEEKFDKDGNNITRDKMGTICDRLGLKLKPRLDINTFDVHEYYTLHYGSEVITKHKGNKVSVAITGRSTTYFDDVDKPIEITVKGKPAVSLSAARASWWSEANSLYPPLSWVGDLAIISIGDDININID